MIEENTKGKFKAIDQKLSSEDEWENSSQPNDPADVRPLKIQSLEAIPEVPARVVVAKTCQGRLEEGGGTDTKKREVVATKVRLTLKSMF